jgi:hypothetical protein
MNGQAEIYCPFRGECIRIASYIILTITKTVDEGRIMINLLFGLC